MRFWQKTYIFTLVLFLICLNVGILSLTVYTYEKTVESTENTVSAEQCYVAMSFERDYNDLTETNNYTSPVLLMQSFGTYYDNKGVFLAFEENGEVIFSNFKYPYNIEENGFIHTDFDGERHIVISTEICEGRYQMIFAKNVASLDTEFQSYMFTYAITTISVSIIFVICLYYILKKLSDPLESLRKTTEVIEAGDFSVTVEEKGSDEFTLLAKSFNAMLKKINDQMAALEQEAEEKKLEADRKQMLVDNLAHELRTPLTSIHGYAEYIEKANATEERKLIAAKYIISEAERLKKISEILLDGAFIRENIVDMKKVSLAEILADVVEKMQMKAEESNVEIVCDTIPMVIEGNETLLSMLFYNLIENAVKACLNGGTVKIYCSGCQVIIEDNGKGMTEEQLSHITEPFYRTDKSRSRAEGGAGLGLALCKQIVQTHGATLHFKSEVRKGTKVVLQFTN